MSDESKQHFVELNNKLIGIAQKNQRVIMEGRRREIENQRAKLTLEELAPLPDDTGLYVNLGRAYMLESKSHLTPRLEADIRDNNAEMEKLAYNEEELNHLTRRPQKETKDKLDAQYKEVEGQLRELLKSDEKLARTVAMAS